MHRPWTWLEHQHQLETGDLMGWSGKASAHKETPPCPVSDRTRVIRLTSSTSRTISLPSDTSTAPRCFGRWALSPGRSIVTLFVFFPSWVPVCCSPIRGGPRGVPHSDRGVPCTRRAQRRPALSAVARESYHLETEGNTTCGEHAYFKIIIIRRCNVLNVE